MRKVLCFMHMTFCQLYGLRLLLELLCSMWGLCHYPVFGGESMFDEIWMQILLYSYHVATSILCV
jgi:hypothetical protein